MEYLFGFLCLNWCALTVGAHLSLRIAAWVAKIDAFGLIPNWSLFAPNPAVTDPHLVCRDDAGQGVVKPFQEMDGHVFDKGLSVAVWNPSRRVSKGILDALTELLVLADSIEACEIRFSLPYLRLANYTLSLPAAPDSVSRQFGIVLCTGFDHRDPPELVFLSEFHVLPRR